MRTSRRQFLRAAGATLWLPFLPSAPGASAAAPDPVRRALWFYVPNGFLASALTPAEAGSRYTTPEPLLPLEALRSRATIVSGLRNLSDTAGERYGFGSHEACSASLLTDVPLPSNYYAGAPRLGTSVDQFAVQRLRPSTPYASLQLGTGEPWLHAGGNVDTYYDRLSWANDTTPLATLVDPRSVFGRLFAGADPAATAAELERRTVLRRSVLDAVHERSTALAARLDAADRQKLDQFTTSVRELEQRIEGLAAVSCAPPDEPAPALAFPDRLRAMTDLIVVALQCDLTRVVTFAAGTTTATTSFPFLGISTDHHTLSHNFAYAERDRTDYLRVQSWYVEQFVDLCLRLAEVPEPGGDLLSSTLVSLVSEFGDGSAHVASPMWGVTAGGESAGLRHGRHLATAGTPHANWLRAALDFLGVAPDGFGTHATGTLDLR